MLGSPATNDLTNMKLKVALTIFISIALASCGGGGSSAPDAQPASVGTNTDIVPVGAYSGTLNGSASPAFQMYVLDDGTFWSPYGVSNANSFQVRGFAQGAGVFRNGSFTSTDEKDFRFSPPDPGVVSGTYTTAHAISGTVTYPDAVVTFSGDTIAASTYTYDTPALLSAIAGSWTISMLNGESANISISNTGMIGGVSASGCNFTGSATPSTSGKNIFNVSLAFGLSPCVLPSQNVKGIGVLTALASGQHQLIIMATDTARAHGTGLFGVR